MPQTKTQQELETIRDMLKKQFAGAVVQTTEKDLTLPGNRGSVTYTQAIENDPTLSAIRDFAKANDIDVQIHLPRSRSLGVIQEGRFNLYVEEHAMGAWVVSDKVGIESLHHN